jgi:hypothetical protein
MPDVLAMDDAGAAEIAVDATSVYWTNYLDHTLNRVPIAGGPASVLLTNPGLTIPALAIDSVSVYVATPTAILSVPLNGGPPTQLATLSLDSPRTRSINI